mmetsp:Transcript_45175/g.107509  ORF Transcript_45175/g.107509 Transcript_45175/m.107509 type:complete len:492 (-) Transcript_45175:120-1595(-)
MSEVKWGILGCAKIAEKVCAAIAEASNAKVVAVASRDKAKADAFAAAHAAGAKTYGTYEELIEDEEVQVVYIPLPTALRAKWVSKAAGKKKHVLSEKPIAGNTKDALAILQACQAAGVQFMDDTMFMHCPRLEAVQRVISDKEAFGTPTHVSTAFTIPCAATDSEWRTGNIRMKKALEPLGALGDLAWYCTRFTLWVYGFDQPEAVSCNFIEETSEGVPIRVLGAMKFSGNRTASFEASFLHSWRQWAEVVSEKQTLRIEDFVIPGQLDSSNFTVADCKVGDKALTITPTVLKSESVPGKAQHTALVEKMSSIALSGTIEDKWPEFSKQTQLLLMAMISSARQQGAWVVPKEPTAKGKGSGKGAKGSGEVQVRKANFQKVDNVNPGSKGLNLEVKVVSVTPNTQTSAPSCTAVVGDASGVANFVGKGEAQVAMITEGTSLVLRNASVKMVQGYITLQVDKWGKMQKAEESFDFAPKTENNISSVEYELVQD